MQYLPGLLTEMMRMRTFDKRLIAFLSLVYFFSFLGYFVSLSETNVESSGRLANNYNASTYFVNSVGLNSVSSGASYSNNEEEEDF